MKKTYKRIMIILLIITIAFSFVPMYKVNAETENNEISNTGANNTASNQTWNNTVSNQTSSNTASNKTSSNTVTNKTSNNTAINNIVLPDNIDRESGYITYSCVTLTQSTLYQNSTGGYIDLNIEGYGLSDDLAGVSGTITGIRN